MKQRHFFLGSVPLALAVALLVGLIGGLLFIHSALAQPADGNPPVAYAGLDRVVNQNSAVTLDGSSSYDPDGDLPLSYLWVQIGGPAVVFSATLSVTAFTAPAIPTVLTFTLVVTDSTGIPGLTPDNIVIRVVGQPIAQDDSGQGFTTDEDTPFVTADVLANDTDPASSPLWVQSFDAGKTLGRVSLVKPAGSLDTLGFGAPNGFVTADFGGYDNAFAMAVQSDGKILLAGVNDDGIDKDFAVARFLPDGNLDSTFGSNGKVTTDFGNTDYANAIVVQPNGKIIVAGYTLKSYDFAMVRYNIDGSLDTTFGNLGKVTTDFGDVDYGNAAALQPDGKIIVAGDSVTSNYFDFSLARYNPDGSLDDSFGSGGKVTTDINNHSYDSATSVAIQADGKIVISGITDDTTVHFALVRYNPDGSLDSSFGSSGMVVTDFSTNGYAYAMTIFNGKIIVAGNTFFNSRNHIAITRYEPNGNLDTTFGNHGLVITDFGLDFWVHAVTVQPGGEIIIAGASMVTEICKDFALERYKPDGSLDTSFGTDAKVTTDFYGMDDCAYSLALQPDGKIVAGGYALSDFALARYNNDSSSFSYNPKGQFNYLAAGEVATDTFSYMVANSVLTATASVFITIHGVNDPPQFASSPIITAIRTIPYRYTIEAFDPDTSNTLTVTATTLPAWLSLANNGDRTATLSGVPPAPGSYPVVLEITDGVASVMQVFSITVGTRLYLPTTFRLYTPPGP